MPFLHGIVANVNIVVKYVVGLLGFTSQQLCLTILTVHCPMQCL